MKRVHQSGVAPHATRKNPNGVLDLVDEQRANETEEPEIVLAQAGEGEGGGGHSISHKRFAHT